MPYFILRPPTHRSKSSWGYDTTGGLIGARVGAPVGLVLAIVAGSLSLSLSSLLSCPLTRSPIERHGAFLPPLIAEMGQGGPFRKRKFVAKNIRVQGASGE